MAGAEPHSVSIPVRPHVHQFSSVKNFIVALKCWCDVYEVRNRIVRPDEKEEAEAFSWFEHLGLQEEEGEA